MDVSAACAWLGATDSPWWLELPPRHQVAQAVRNHMRHVRRGLEDGLARSGAPSGDVVQALYLAEGLWGLDQVCRQLGRTLVEADDNWITEIVLDPAYEPLRGILALGLYTTGLAVVVQEGVPLDDFLTRAAETERSCIVWRSSLRAAPSGLETPVDGLSLDGCAVLREHSTIAWLVSSLGPGGQEYKALACRVAQ